jgi:two-component system, sensor histidine kinase
MARLDRGLPPHTHSYNWAPGSAKRDVLVLVVEPDDDSRALLRMLLESSGFTVAECHDSDRLIDEITRLRPHLIVLEERLPRVDGRTACQRLRGAAEDIRHTPVILISSSSDPSSVRLAFDAGCTLHFVKPVDIHDLMDAATELAAGPQALA